MKVVYYTLTPFLDCAIELINVLKKHVELHVIIEISPESKTSNIIDVEELPQGELFIHPSKLLKEKNFKMLEPYLAGTASANFLSFTHKRSFSFATVRSSMKAGGFINSLEPDVIHFESFSPRSLGMIPYILSCKKIFFTVHDPLPHSGESNWRTNLAKFLSMRLAKGYFFYSNFARRQFEKYYKNVKEPKYVLSLFPYHFYKAFKPTEGAKEYLLFFGRISPYKGIDVLLKAMPYFLIDHPHERLIIAGKSLNGYAMDKEVLTEYKENIKVIDKYLSNQELVSLISKAKVVVCPYKDATQSGVLMTAFALNTPVIATEVGAFPEYIDDGKNGMLFPVNDILALAKKMSQVTESRFYESLEQYLNDQDQNDGWITNLSVIMRAYKGDKELPTGRPGDFTV